jgi:hypothetical protein
MDSFQTTCNPLRGTVHGRTRLDRRGFRGPASCSKAAVQRIWRTGKNVPIAAIVRFTGFLTYTSFLNYSPLPSSGWLGASLIDPTPDL